MSKNQPFPQKSRKLFFIETDSFFTEVYSSTDFLEGFDRSGLNSMSPETLGLIGKSGNKKGSIFYVAHSYPTKIPVENIADFILKNTKPGDTVMDPFCGSGMTGLAAKLTGRNAEISDIGSLALHLSANHVRNCDPIELKKQAELVLHDVTEEKNEYEVKIDGKVCELNFLVVSDIVKCGSCGKSATVWEFIVGDDLHTKKTAVCPNCKHKCKTSQLDLLGSRPVFASYWEKNSKSLKKLQIGKSRSEQFEYRARRKSPVSDVPVSEDREMYIRSALHLHKVSNVSDFYSDRNLSALTRLHKRIQLVKDKRIRAALMFAFTNTSWHGSKMRRYNSKGGHRPLTGTLYIPQLISEGNVYKIFANKIETLCDYYDALKRVSTKSSVTISKASALDLEHVKSRSIDYIFTDPPFGSNIFYADCNILAEAWLGQLTNLSTEAVVNKSLKEKAGGKSLSHYSEMMRNSFSEMSRVLKPGGKAHIVFNSTDGKVWASLIEAMSAAGLKVVGAHSLDKVQKSFKGNKSALGQENVSTKDVVFEVVVTNKRSQSTSRAQTESPEKVLKRAWSAFSRAGINPDESKFIVADFYNYLVRRCATEKFDPVLLDYERVKSFVAAV
ncbi:MAG: hypothetical protein KF799_10035 [Bdellovibrionales bacterium]|nr:hypothetical protein [Bdellovibrionales bacterium]